jgi:surface protein
MFKNATSFDQDISNWNVYNVTNMSYMFYSATSFNYNLSSWDVSGVNNMTSMFQYATSFDSDLSSWCVASIPSLPTNFDTGASSWVLSRPVWGTCPSLPSAANKFDAADTNSYPGSGSDWYNIGTSVSSSDVTLYNSVNYNSGDGGGCLEFNGTNNYGIIPYDSTFDFSTGNYTINTWVKFNDFSSPVNVTSKDTYGANFDWSIYIPDSSNIYDYSNGTATNVSANIPSSMSTSVWYLITISSISGYVSIYLNKVEYGTTTYMSTSNSNTTALTIGCYSWNNPGALLNGNIAIMEYYNVGLSDTEVSTYFNTTKSRFGY